MAAFSNLTWGQTIVIDDPVTEETYVCYRTENGIFEIKTVIVGESQNIIALEDAAKNVLNANNYAVVIELIPGDGNDPATETWEVRTDNEFELDSITKSPNYLFKDLITQKTYDCEINQTVYANPALTRVINKNALAN